MNRFVFRTLDAVYHLVLVHILLSLNARFLDYSWFCDMIVMLALFVSLFPICRLLSDLVYYYVQFSQISPTNDHIRHNVNGINIGTSNSVARSSDFGMRSVPIFTRVRLLYKMCREVSLKHCLKMNDFSAIILSWQCPIGLQLTLHHKNGSCQLCGIVPGSWWGTCLLGRWDFCCIEAGVNNAGLWTLHEGP